MIVKFEYILHQVVAIRIFNECLHVHDDKVGKIQLLILRALLKTSLHYTASVLVLSNLNTVVHASIEDELSVLCIPFAPLIVDISWAF